MYITNRPADMSQTGVVEAAGSLNFYSVNFLFFNPYVHSGAYTRYTVEEDVGDHVDPRVFNTAMWDAWHYGEDAVIESAVKQTRKIFVDNSCGRYHQKMNKRREEARREAMRVMEAQMAAADQQRREDISARLRKQSEARKQQRSSGNDMSVGRSGESMGRSNSKQKDNSNEEKGNCFVS